MPQSIGVWSRFLSRGSKHGTRSGHRRRAGGNSGRNRCDAGGCNRNEGVRLGRPQSGTADDIRSPNNRTGSIQLRKVAYYWHTGFLRAARMMLDFRLNSFIIKWWAEMDSNHRRLSPADLQSLIRGLGHEMTGVDRHGQIMTQLIENRYFTSLCPRLLMVTS